MGKGEYFSCLIKPRPARFDYFMVMSVDIARLVAQQKKLDEFMKAHALTTVDCGIPVRDRFNRHQQFALNAGFFPHLTYSRLFWLLTGIYESFGQAPAPTFANASNGDFWMVFLAAKNPAASGNLFLSW